jgi:ribosome modulation factor
MNQDAYEAGYDAYWDGGDVSENPYNQETDAEGYRSWEEGWRKAREHDYDESEG